jgi:hypothetical protein
MRERCEKAAEAAGKAVRNGLGLVSPVRHPEDELDGGRSEHFERFPETHRRTPAT